MKKLNLNATYKEAKELAIELGIHYVGKTTAKLIEMVNEEIDNRFSKVETNKSETTESKNKEVKKGHTLEEYGLQEGQIIKISGFEVKDGKKILEGRLVSITRTSRRKGYIKGRLVNEQTGELQKTEIAITMDIIIEQENIEVA